MTRHASNQFSNGFMEPSYMDYRHSGHARLGGHHQMSQDRHYSLGRPNPRVDPMSSNRLPRNHNTQSAHTLQSTSAGTPGRRRIPVACARCRKRKIKCTGDPGDNSGCTNCKTAKVPVGSCVFTRVSSNNIDMSPPSPSTMDNMGIHHSSISPPSLHASLSSHHQSGPRSSHGMHLHGSNDFKSHYSANTDPLLSGATRYDTPSVLMTSRSYDSINPHDLSSLSGSVGGVGSSSNPGGDLYSGAPHFLLPSTDSANVNGLTDGINHNSQVHPSLQQQTDYSQRSSWPASGSSGLKSNYTSAPATAYYVDINNAHNLTSAYTIPAGPSSIPRLTSSAASSASSAAAAMGTLPTATTMDNYSIFPALSILSSSLPTNDISQHAQKSLPPLPGMPPKPDYNSPSPNSGYGRVFNTTDAYRSTYATTSVTPISTDAMGVSCTSGVTSASMATSSNTTVSQTGPSPSISRTPSRMGTTNGSGSGGGYIAASGGLMSVSTVTGSSGEYGYLSHQGQEVGRDNGAGQGSGTPRRVLTPLSDMAGSRSTHENDTSPGGRCSLDERRRTKGH